MRLIVILVLSAMVVLVVVMAWSFVRNAVALRRDLNKRFDALGKRLADEAESTIDPLLRRDPKDNAN
jgi:uncharacterized membrane protein affecting hemolysin expression